MAFSVASRRQAAAERFARASHVDPQDGANESIDFNDYDAFVESRDSSSTVAQPVHSMPPAIPHIINITSPYGRLDPSAMVAQFGTPIPPPSAKAANRRLFYLRHHLLAQPDPHEATAAAAAHAGLQAKPAAVQTGADASPSPSDLTDYFDDAEMERRRPGLYYEYIGRFKEQEESSDEEEDDENERQRRRGVRNQRQMTEEPEEEQKSSRSVAPLPSRSKSKNAQRPPQHLPGTLSELLLTNYDRAELKKRREAAEATGSTVPTAAGAVSVAPPPAAVGQRRPATSTAARTSSSSMVDSDESELDDDDTDMQDVVAPSSRLPAISFHPDDGITTAEDGSDLREAGPTASKEFAEWAREMVEDDMDWKVERQKRRDNEREQQESTDSRMVDDAAASTDTTVPSASPASSPPPSIPSDDPSILRAEFLHLMQQLFLDGYDGAFVDYQRIDSSEENEDLTERERTEQEEYFDHTDTTEEQQPQQHTTAATTLDSADSSSMMQE